MDPPTRAMLSPPVSAGGYRRPSAGSSRSLASSLASHGSGAGARRLLLPAPAPVAGCWLLLPRG
eukprot:COSAG01_NODE_1083_length_11812_cov_9.648510_4_plen_64_part_00